MQFSTLEYALWILGFASSLGLLGILVVRRRLGGRWPFAVLVAYPAVVNAVLFFVFRFGNAHSYFLSYYILGFADYVVRLFVVWHFARTLLKPLQGAALFTKSALLLFVAFTLCAAFVAFAGGGGSQTEDALRGFALWENRITIFTSLMMCGIVVGIFLIANRYYLQIGKYLFAIGQGLFLVAYSILLADFAHATDKSSRWSSVITICSSGSFLAVLWYWMVVFWQEEPTKPPLPDDMMHYLAALHTIVREDLGRTLP